MVAVRQMPSAIGSVEFSMKKSAECSTKPRSVSTGPPRITFTPPARVGNWMRSAAGMTSSFTNKSEKLMFGAGWLTTMPMAPSEEWAQI